MRSIFRDGGLFQQVQQLRVHGRIKSPHHPIPVLAAIVFHHHPGAALRIVGARKGARGDHLADAVDLFLQDLDPRAALADRELDDALREPESAVICVRSWAAVIGDG